MTHDFTLVYELPPDMGARDDVLRRLADSGCRDVTVGLGRHCAIKPKEGLHNTRISVLTR